MNWIRRSFGAKLFAALIGTVGLLLTITLVVVRAQTNREIRLVEDRTVRSAEQLFQELNELQRQQADQLARPFTESRRTLVLLDEAIRTRDIEYLAGEAAYELLRSGLAEFDDALVVLTDDRGTPVISMIGGETVEGDPADVAPLARAVLQSQDVLDMSAYRVVDGRLYNLQAHFIELAYRPIGTITFGLPILPDDLERMADIGVFEVCLLVEGSCLVASSGVDPRMEARMASSVAGSEPLRTDLGGTEWSIQHEALVPGEPRHGRRVVAVPLDEVRAPFENIQLTLLLTGGGALLLCTLLAIGLSRSLMRPVRDLVTATGRVAEGEYETQVDVRSQDEIGTLADAFNDMTRGLRLRERYRSVLNKVVSQDVATELMTGEVELGGENREISVLFADIRGFTSMTFGMEPQEVIQLLNDCMEQLSRAVDGAGGVVDKFIGDEIMAVFGAPVAQEDHARRALRAALRMRRGMAEINEERAAAGVAPLGVGIGIATGIAVAGNMGSADRLNYTVLGETVNLAARLTDEAAAGEILINERTRSSVTEGLVATCVGERSFKGFARKTLVYSVSDFEAVETAGA
ncbi:MAG: adenylate/guanylate cyclase domain-containing protein [Longimicrobiales bacterium]|nr:adenylate/guanylate cyclase domain-containing protein [Longimicrobiales bacterium]